TDLIEVRAGDLPPEYRALHINGGQHARHDEVDTVERTAGDDGKIVDIVNARADDPELRRILQRDTLEVRWAHLGSLGAGLAIRARTTARTVVHYAVARFALRRGHAP